MELAAILLLGLTIFMIVMSPLGSISPAAILSGSLAFVYIGQSILASDMESSFLATMAIFSITLSFALGELIACGGVRSNKYIQETTTATLIQVNDDCENGRKLKRIVLFFGVTSIAGTLQYANALGLFEARSLADLILLPGMTREKIFSGEVVVSLFSRVGFLLAYSGVVLALAYYYLYKWRWWIILPMIAVLLLGMSQAGRAGILIVLLQVILSVYLKNVIVRRRSAVRSFLHAIVVPGVLICIVFVGGQIFREGLVSMEIEDILRVINSLRGYLFGGVSAFSYWINTIYDWGLPTFGRYSFSSLFAVFGIFPQAPGVYDEYASISAIGETSNIYTAFRSFIDDFTIIGAYLFYSISGFFIASITRGIVKGRSVLIFVLIPLLSWLAFSPMISLTYFNSFLLSCFLPYFLVQKFSFMRKMNTLENDSKIRLNVTDFLK